MPRTCPISLCSSSLRKRSLCLHESEFSYLLRVDRNGTSTSTFSLILPVKSISSFSSPLPLNFYSALWLFLPCKLEPTWLLERKTRFKCMIMDINSLSLRIFIDKMGVRTIYHSMLLKIVMRYT